MNVSLFGALPLALALAWSPTALAQQSDAQRCLDAVKPVLRNEDGSLSPNPAFDECLRNPLITARPAPRPPISAPRAAALPVGALAVSTAAQANPQSEWRASSAVLVESTIRSWLPPGWQLKWDTKEKPRGTGLQVTGDFLDAMKALAGTRRQWTDTDGSRLQILIFKADRIVQVRDATAVIDPAPGTATAVRTESLSGATP